MQTDFPTMRSPAWIRCFILCATCLLSVNVVFAQMPTYQKRAANVYEMQYTNGLRAVLKVDHRAPVLFFSIWYHVGSAEEPFGLTGISHFLEHLMFRGTTLLPDGAYAAKIAQDGGEQNAFTSSDHTAYYAFLPTKHWLDAATMDANRMHHLLLNTGVVDKERQVILEERHWRVDEHPLAYAFERLNALYAGSPYAHPVIGWAGDIRQINDQDLYQWYCKWYQPDHATIVAVGDVSPQAFFNEIGRHYGALLNTSQVISNAHKTYTPPDPVGRTDMRVRWGQYTRAVLLSYQVPVIKTLGRATWPADALEVMAYMLAGNDHSVLTQSLVYQSHLALHVAVYYDPFLLYDTAFTIVAIPATGVSLDRLQKALLQQMAALWGRTDIDQQLAWAKTDAYADQVYNSDQLTTQGMWLGQLLSVGLPIRDEKTYQDGLRHITLSELQTVSAQYCVPDNLKVVILSPRHERSVSETVQQNSQLSDAQASTVAQFWGQGEQYAQMA